MRTEGAFLGFEELELNEGIDDEEFRWDGPVDLRNVGKAFVARDREGRYTVSWQVAVRGRPMFHQQGPEGIGRDEAIAWGEARAATTVVRDE